MGYANGRLPSSALTLVQSGIYLSTPTARAWKKAVADAKKVLGRNLSIAPPAGGYRSYATQADMRVHPSRYNMNPNSGASLAQPGYSNHGLGICVDVVGSPIDNTLINFLKKYGFSRPLWNDPNHFMHDGKTAIGILPVVPKPTLVKKYVKVVKGDTLSKIASRNKITLSQLLTLNPSISNPDKIAIGQKIRVK